VIDVVRPGQVNNGNIEILDIEPSSTHDKVAVDEVFINGKRYRVPERIIKLDFWDKVYGQHGPTQRSAQAHTFFRQCMKRSDRSKNGADVPLSPLTSLSSLDGDENETNRNPLRGMGVEDVRLALVGFAHAVLSSIVINIVASCLLTWRKPEYRRKDNVNQHLRGNQPRGLSRTEQTLRDVWMLRHSQ